MCGMASCETNYAYSTLSDGYICDVSNSSTNGKAEGFARNAGQQLARNHDGRSSSSTRHALRLVSKWARERWQKDRATVLMLAELITLKDTLVLSARFTTFAHRM
jgi:hypothetical protein